MKAYGLLHVPTALMSGNQPCSPLKNNRRFGENVALTFRVEEYAKPKEKPHAASSNTLVHFWGFIADHEDGGDISLKCRLFFNGLRGFTSQTIDLLLLSSCFPTNRIHFRVETKGFSMIL
jgi:hypothetical protein